MPEPFAVSNDAFSVSNNAFTSSVSGDFETIIDDFEDGNRDGWDVPGSTGSDTVRSGGLNGTDWRWEHSGFREGHLRGSDAADRGPQQGDRISLWFRVTPTISSDDIIINRFKFASSSTDDGDRYQVEFRSNTGDPDADGLELEKLTGGSRTKFAFHNDVGIISQNESLQCVINWNNGNNLITAQIYDSTGSARSNQISFEDTQHTQPGIALFTSDRCVCDWDEFRIDA